MTSPVFRVLALAFEQSASFCGDGQWNSGKEFGHGAFRDDYGGMVVRTAPRSPARPDLLGLAEPMVRGCEVAHSNELC